MRMRRSILLLAYSILLLAADLQAYCPFSTVVVRVRIDGQWRADDEVVATLETSVKSKWVQESTLTKREFAMNLRYWTLSREAPLGGLPHAIRERCEAKTELITLQLIRRGQVLDSIRLDRKDFTVDRKDFGEDFGIFRVNTPAVLKVQNLPKDLNPP